MGNLHTMLVGWLVQVTGDLAVYVPQLGLRTTKSGKCSR